MSGVAVRRWPITALFVFLTTASVLCPLSVFAQQESTRKLKIRIAPNYPALARSMSIGGVVKLDVLIAADGRIKSMKVVGGHPLLIQAAVDAVRKWRYEPAAAETLDLVEVRFRPGNDPSN